MVDINRVSADVQAKIKEVGQMDGKKGITSKAERDELANYLASGQISGYNLEYVQEQINQFDLRAAKDAATDWARSTIDKIMKNTGDKHEIDDTTELAALDEIINDPNSSPEDVAYAKAVRANSEFVRQHEMKNENTRLRADNQNLTETVTGLREENGALKAENDKLQAELEKAEAELEEALAVIEGLNAEVEELRGKNSALATELSSALKSIKDLKKSKAELRRTLSKALFNKDNKTNNSEVIENIKQRAREIDNNISNITKEITSIFKNPDIDKKTVAKFTNAFKKIGIDIGAHAIAGPVGGTAVTAARAFGL